MDTGLATAPRPPSKYEQLQNAIVALIGAIFAVAAAYAALRGALNPSREGGGDR